MLHVMLDLSVFFLLVQFVIAGSSEQCGADALGNIACEDNHALLQAQLHLSTGGASPTVGTIAYHDATSPSIGPNRERRVHYHDKDLLQADASRFVKISDEYISLNEAVILSDLHTKMIAVVATTSFLLLLALSWLVGLPYALDMLIFVVYIIWSSALLFVNKSLVHQVLYVHPVALVTLHQLTCTLLTQGLKRMMPQLFIGLQQLQDKTGQEHRDIYMSVAIISGCFAVSIAAENLSYFYSSVAFLQMIKETGLIIITALSVAMGLDIITPRRSGLLMLVVIGAIMCVRGEVHLEAWGVILQMMSNLCNGMRLTLQNKLLVQDAGVKLDPLSYVALVSPFCFGTLLLPALAVLVAQPTMLMSFRLSIGMVTTSCTLAAGLNLLVAVLVQRVSAIGFSLLGAVKNALIILLSCLALGKQTTLCQILGCSLIFASSVVYAMVKESERAMAAMSTTCADKNNNGMDQKDGLCGPDGALSASSK